MKKLACLLLALTPALASADKSLTKGTTWDCKKDPVVAINHGGGTYKFTGECKTIAINGGGVTLSADDVDELSINGGGCTVTVGAADRIAINGATNKVTWKKGKSGDKPNITINGADNKIDQAK